VDLNPSSALIPLKLLILQYAKLAQLAKKAILSYTFLTHCLLTRPLEPLPLLLAIAASQMPLLPPIALSLPLETLSTVSGLVAGFKPRC
jgi:hypothetical protein